MHADHCPPQSASPSGYGLTSERREHTIPGGESAGAGMVCGAAEQTLPKPYYDDGRVTIYNNRAEALLPLLQRVDAVVTDPPYAGTSLEWDYWPDGWPALVLPLAPVLWSFGSFRMFLETRDEFRGWKFAQDIVWEKHNGSGSASDRFRRVHEIAAQFYQGEWAQLHHVVPMTMDATKRVVKTRGPSTLPHWGEVGTKHYATEEGGPRMTRSVIYARSCNSYALHPTQKPEAIIRPLLEYSVPLGGIVLDPFMGSGTTLLVARELGMRAIGIESNPDYCAVAVHRLAQATLGLGGASCCAAEGMLGSASEAVHIVGHHG